MADVSNTRLYLGNLPRTATKADVENHFNSHGTGEITEIKLMSGFGFIEYKDALDARDVVPAFHGSDFMGERLIVQFARGNQRPREDGYGQPARQPPRPRRTVHRMTINNLPFETSWQDLKDFARQSGEPVYSEINRERDASGNGKGFVEYETAEDLAAAVAKLDNTEFKGSTVHCISDPQSEVPRPRERRSRSPGGYRNRGYGPPHGGGGDDYYDRRGPPRGGYSPPRRDDYRRRTPPPRDYYDDRGYGPPRGRPDDYPPPPRYPDERGYNGPPPARRGYEPDPYMNGHGGGRDPYARAPSPRREGGGGYERGGYDRPRY